MRTCPICNHRYERKDIRHVVCSPKCEIEKKKKDDKRTGFFRRNGNAGISGRKNSIAKVSVKKKKAKHIISQNKALRISLVGARCESCGLEAPLDWSHLIPISVRPDLETEYENGCLHCSDRNGGYGCHEALEHLKGDRIKKFKNLDYILSYLLKTDTKRYNLVVSKISL